MKSYVTVSIRHPVQGIQKEMVLGEYSDLLGRGISIGSNPECTVCLESSEVAAVAVQAFGASNHIVLYRLPSGTSLPLTHDQLPHGSKSERVDEGEFQVGFFMIKFCGIGLAEEISHLARPRQSMASKRVHTEETHSRLCAINKLSLLGEKARAAIPALLYSLLDPELKIRTRAAETLHLLQYLVPFADLTSEELTKRLTELLSDRDGELRSEALRCLALLGNQATPAVPYLQNALSDSQICVRISAAAAVWHITQQSEGLVNVLSECLKILLEEDLKERLSVGNVWTKASSDRFRLIKEAASCLGEMGGKAESAIPVLVDMFSMHSNGSNFAEDVLIRIGRPAVPALIASLSSEDHIVRRDTISMLGKIGPDANASVPALLRQLHHEKGETDWLRKFIYEALARIDVGKPLFSIPASPPRQVNDGDFKVQFRPDPINAIAGIIAGIVITLASGIFWAIRNTFGFFLGSVILVIGLIIIRYAIGLFYRRVEFDDRGFRFFTRSETNDVLWTEIASIRENVVYTGILGAKHLVVQLVFGEVPNYSYIVEVKSGKRLKFDANSVADIQRFGRFLRIQATKRSISWKTTELRG